MQATKDDIQPRVTEDYLREHETDIRRLSMDAIYKYTKIDRAFIRDNEDEFLNDMRFRVWKWFDPTRGALSTFLHYCAVNRIRQMWKEHNRYNSRIVNVAETSDEDMKAYLLNRATPVDKDGGIEEAINDIWMDSIEERLTDEQCEVFGLLREGVERPTDIARKLRGITTWHGAADLPPEEAKQARREYMAGHEWAREQKKAIGEIVMADILEAAGRISYAANDEG